MSDPTMMHSHLRSNFHFMNGDEQLVKVNSAVTRDILIFITQNLFFRIDNPTPAEQQRKKDVCEHEDDPYFLDAICLR